MSAAAADAALAVGGGLSRLKAQLPLLAALQAGANLYGSPRFNPFVVLAPNETALSRVLGDLLDPRGSHGQGPLFLNAFCEVTGLPRLALSDHARVTLEASTLHHRRIDVLVETDAFLLGIENKPWAGQQKDQLADYWQELKRRAAGRRIALMFISDQEEESARGEVVKLPLAGQLAGGTSLASLLTAQRPQVRSERAQRFIDDFVSYLELEFGDVPQSVDMEGYQSAVDLEFERDGAGRQAIAAVLVSAARVRKRLIDEIEDELLARVRAEAAPDFVASTERRLSSYLYERYGHWPLRRPFWPQNCTVSLESQNADAKRLIVGVRAPEPDNPAVKADHRCDVRERLAPLSSDMEAGRSGHYWAWYRYLSPGHWDNESLGRMVLESPNGEIGKHPLIQELGGTIVKLAKAVDALLTTPQP